MIHFLIITLGSADLVALALSSIRRYAPASMIDLVPLHPSTNGARAHGAAIDQWRDTYAGQVADGDVVVIMDPDVVLLSAQWCKEVEGAFADERVGIWGAGARDDFGPRVHAHMMCIRGRVWNTVQATFTPCRDMRERAWRDTGGLYCLAAIDAGWQVQPLERGPDWHGVSAWWGRQEWSVQTTMTILATAYAHLDATPKKMYTPTPLWAHLGSSTHSDPLRLTWWQRLRRWRQIKQRRQFIAAVRNA